MSGGGSSSPKYEVPDGSLLQSARGGGSSVVTEAEQR
jgi:hypothetical protein